MKLTIDEKVCLKHKLSLDEFLIAFSWTHIEKPDEVLENLIKKGVVSLKDNKYYLSPHWDKVMNDIVSTSLGGTDDEERLVSLAKKMMECFPEGKKLGSPYYYRCNKTEVVKKLRTFFTKYGNYTDEQIIDATKRFIASFNGNYRYLPLIKYFISKLKPVQEENGEVHNVEYSPLADYLENEGQDADKAAQSDDWLMTSRN